jgi:hypothetical protein
MRYLASPWFRLLAGLALLLLLVPGPDARAAQDGGTAPPADGPPLWPVSGGSPLRGGYTSLLLPRTNTVRWRITLPGAGIFGSSPVVDSAHRTLLVTNDTLTSTPQSVLWCIDREGNVAWSRQFSDEFEFQPVLLSSGRILLLSVRKQLYAFDSLGTLLWQRQYSASPRIGDSEIWANYTAGLDQPTHVQPLPDRDGGVLVVDDAPSLLSIDGEGRLRWQTELYGSCAGGLLLINGYVYTPACDGRLHIYSAANGKEVDPIALGGLAPFHPTGLPGAGVFSPLGNSLGERLRLVPFAGMSGFEVELGGRIRTPLTISATSELVIAIGTAGTTDGKVPTQGQILGLDSRGKLRWSRDIGTIPAGSILADSTGRYCFGTQDIGVPGVYGLDPKHGVEWWISTRGASTVYPVADGLLGVQVSTARADDDKNKVELLAIGERE